VLAAAFLLPTTRPIEGCDEFAFKEAHTMSKRLARFFASRWGVILAGAVVGVLAPLLQKLGNPPNMGS
jgi:hypothetical protein